MLFQLKYLMYEILENILQIFQNAQETATGLRIKDTIVFPSSKHKAIVMPQLGSSCIETVIHLGIAVQLDVCNVIWDLQGENWSIINSCYK